MNKFVLALHSRTVWTLIIMVAYNILTVYGKTLSPDMNTLVNLVLGGVATYFRVNPSTPEV